MLKYEIQFIRQRIYILYEDLLFVNAGIKKNADLTASGQIRVYFFPYRILFVVIGKAGALGHKGQ